MQLEARDRPTKKRNHSRIAARYERDVESGKVPACKLLKLAIERQRRDLGKPPEGYRFDAAYADKICRLMEVLPCSGEGPRRGQPFVLEPWEVWLVRVLYGWLDETTGTPRFRLAHIWLPKGNGKTPLAALICLVSLIMGGGGEKIYSAASTQKQARHVFDAAQEMLRLAPEVRETFGLIVEEHLIKGQGDARKFEPVSSEAGSIEGVRPSVLVLDEVHVLPNRKLYDNLRSAANKVDGSRFVTISTAGFDMSPQAIGWQLYSRTKEILLGTAEDPMIFALIVEADADLPPDDFETWLQANPNVGISVSLVGLKSAFQTWKEVPSERPSLETKHLGWWQQSAHEFIDIRRWIALGNPELSIADLDPTDGWEAYVGVDLARTRDLSTAAVVIAKTREDGKRDYRIFTRATYLPAASPTLGLVKDLKQWAEQGWLTLLRDADGSPAESMTFKPLVAEIEKLLPQFPSLQVCIDRYMAAEVENDLMERGITVVEVAQGAKTQSEPMRELEAAILDARLEHDGSPVAAMCIANLLAENVGLDAIKPGRENENKKIDIAVAIVNALVAAKNGSASEQHVGPLLM